MMTPDEILEQLKQKFGDAIGETEVREVEVRLTTTSEHAREICRLLRELGFEYLELRFEGNLLLDELGPKDAAIERPGALESARALGRSLV